MYCVSLVTLDTVIVTKESNTVTKESNTVNITYNYEPYQLRMELPSLAEHCDCNELRETMIRHRPSAGLLERLQLEPDLMLQDAIKREETVPR